MNNLNTKDYIIVKGAKENNLQNIDVVIPKNKLVIITGLSGSGKSSLAFDTIYAEGQRRYVESLSSYVRQFLGGNEKPDVDSIEGLSPAISIDQKTTSHNPRSIVGTVTEIYDYLRLLYARIGIPYCINGHGLIEAQTVKQIVDKIMQMPNESKIQILAPIIQGQRGQFIRELEKLRRLGYLRIRLNDAIVSLDEKIELDKSKKHNIDVVIDRIVLHPDQNTRTRISEAVEAALKEAGGTIIVNNDKLGDKIFSENHACKTCGFNIPDLEPKLFSFNSPSGACESCKGLGVKLEADEDLLMPNKDISIRQGGIEYYKNIVDSTNIEWQQLETLLNHYGISMDTPIKKLSDADIKVIMKGSKEAISYTIKSKSGHKWDGTDTIEGIGSLIERRYFETTSEQMRSYYVKYLSEKKCPTCKGKRLNQYARAVKIGNLDITEFSDMAINIAIDFLLKLTLTKEAAEIGKLALKEIVDRLSFLENVGLGYLTLSRNASSLSGGEAQRIRLATQIGSQLTGVLYVLDEPSIGLHQKDNMKLINTLKKMRDLGNSLLVVEHDEETMHHADWIIDIGPGAGEHGGKVIAEGTPEQIIKNPKSITGQYLSGKHFIPMPKKQRSGNGVVLEIKGASENNLKHIDVKFPLGKFIAITGVSGSGKSSLINEVLSKAIERELGNKFIKPGKFDSILNASFLDRVVKVSQDPIGRTPRSNPATYADIFTEVRELYSNSPEAKVRGYLPGRFSFNVKGGRCEKCQGDGVIRISMQFLPDVYIQCEECEGKRYNDETLQIKYKGKNIYDVLELTVDEGVEFFENIPSLKRKIETLKDVGLGYIKLGQSSDQLSGGEAQRIKLAKYLQKKNTGKSLFILDEPTTGLHTADVAKLIEVLNRIADSGDTVIVIEHNLDIIKSVDYIIDLGPDGGNGGGKLITSGTPYQVMNHAYSYTAKYLKEAIKRTENFEKKTSK